MTIFLLIETTDKKAMVIAVDDISAIIQNGTGSTIWLKSSEEIMIETDEDILKLAGRLYEGEQT